MLLGLVVPGLGQAVATRPRRGAALGALTAVAFASGLALGGGLVKPDTARPMTMLGAIASHAIGAPAFATRLLGGGRGDLRSATYEYGSALVFSAGLMNVLTLFDAWDLARRGATPSGRERA